MISDIVKNTDSVLDIGFWGQGIPMNNPYWVHGIIKKRAKEVYGVDLSFDTSLFDCEHYQKVSAEDFRFDRKFDVIIASDLIEHLTNPGKLLDRCREHINPGGKIVITTGTTFSLFNLAGKITREDPINNYDHTCYFTPGTMKTLSKKCGLQVVSHSYIYTAHIEHKQSLKKKFLNLVYWTLSKFTGKFCEEFVVIISLPSKTHPSIAN